MKRKTIVLVTLLVLTNVIWVGFYAYSQIDCGLTLTYQDASFRTQSKMLEQAVAIANQNLVGKPLSEAREVLDVDSYGTEPFIKNGCLYAGGLCLEIGDNSIIVGIKSE